MDAEEEHISQPPLQLGAMDTPMCSPLGLDRKTAPMGNPLSLFIFFGWHQNVDLPHSPHIKGHRDPATGVSV